jgi:hypothetical protein
MELSLKRLIIESEQKWEKPSFEEEREEFERTAEELDIPIEKLETAFKEGNLRMMPKSIWEKLKNTDSTKTESFYELVMVLQKYQKKDPEFERDWKGLRKAFDKKLPMKAPIVLKHDKEFYLISGNTRLMVAKVLETQPVFIYLVSV